MKDWLETRQVFDRLAAWFDAGEPCALATVVGVRGSAYRHEGAKMVVNARGESLGNVSGGCLEADVREVALRVIRTGQPELREYCGSADEIAAWDLGVGCDGVVEIFVEPVRDAREAERAALAAERPFTIATNLTTGERQVLVGADAAGPTLGDLAAAGEVAPEAVTFLDILLPPPRLLVVSAGDDARPLAALAASVGFRVVVADRRPGLLTPERFPAPIRLIETDAAGLAAQVELDDHSYAVVMTHNFADDRDYLRALLPTKARYIGMLGPRQRTARILGALQAEGPVDASRVYGPVGLDIGTDGAEQVALSVVAEMLAVRSGRRPQSLRERPTPIHEEPSAPSAAE